MKTPIYCLPSLFQILSKFLSYRARISEEFNSREGSKPTKLEQRAPPGLGPILVKLGLRESCDSKLSGLCILDNMVILLSHKMRYKSGR